MDKILITGSKGQLGNELQEIEKGFINLKCLFHDVDTLDITDLRQLEQFFDIHHPKFVINCAAYTAVDKAESDVENATKINVLAVQYLAEVCRKNNTYLFHISTDYVFDGKSWIPYNEDMPVNPLSVYGKTKEQGEQFILSYDKGLTIRTSWLYSSFGKNFVKTMLHFGKEKGALNVVFDEIGCPTYAADLALAIQHIVNQTQNVLISFKPGIYHYSNEGICSRFDFAKVIMDYSDISCKINPIEIKDYPTPAKRPLFSAFNKSKIKSIYGVSVPYWMDSLKICLKKID